MFFLRILTYQSTLKNHYSTKIDTGETTSPPSPIFLNAIMIKIYPRDKEFAMLILRFYGFSDIVAWGHHLRVQLRSQNCALPGPHGKKYTTINQKTTARWHKFCHHDQTCPWWGRALSLPSKRLPSPSQDPSWHTLYLLLCLRFLHDASKPLHSVAFILTILCQPYAIILSTMTAPSPAPPPTKINAKLENVATNTPVSFWVFPCFIFHCQTNLVYLFKNTSFFTSMLCNFHSCSVSTCPLPHLHSFA